MDALKANEKTDIADFTVNLSSDFFLENNFNIGAVNTKIFIMLLASRGPHSLLSNAKINLEEVLLRCNRNEFHHIFPKNHLLKSGVSNQINALANFCFLSSADNQKIKDKEPMDYIELIDPKIHSSVFDLTVIPMNWETMSYEQFLKARSKLLVDYAASLMK